MVIKKILFLAICSLWVASLWAQTDGVYFPETRYTQRLAWTGDVNALRYEVLVEKEDGTDFQRVLQQFTTASYIEVSMPPGNYRYQVIPYDVFNRPARGSQWMAFEIRAAVRPELISFAPNFFLFDKDTDFMLVLSGKNLLRGAEIFLRQLGADNAPIVPVRVDIEQDGSQARLRFNYEQFQPGFYVVFVKNPGGQEASKGELTIGYSKLHPGEASAQPDAEGSESGQSGSDKKLFDIQMSVFWLPMIPIYGGMEQLFGEGIYLPSAAVRFGMFINKPIFQPGLELMASWYGLKEQTDDFDTEVQVMAGAVYLALQIWFANDKAAFTLRAGLGMGYQTGVYNNYLEDDQKDIIPMNGSAPHADLGATFILAFKNYFTLEFGCYYTHMLVKENASGYVRPSIGIGWQF